MTIPGLVIINSPNNPTGQVYDEAMLRALGEVLAKGSARFGRPIYLINDEPYRRLVYDGLSLPSVFQAYPGFPGGHLIFQGPVPGGGAHRLSRPQSRGSGSELNSWPA